MHISGSQRQPRGDNRNDSYESRSSNNKPYQNRSYSTQSNYRNQSLANQQSIPMASPLAYMTGLAMQNPLIPGNMPSFGMQVQGYRSSAENREYVPQYVSFDAPPASFRGGVPINHPNHQVPLDDRRARLLEQQRYVNQSSAQRDYNSRHRR